MIGILTLQGSRCKQLLRLAVGSALLIALVIGAGRQAFADGYDFPGGDGSPGNPYVVMTAEDLDHVRDDLDAYYVLGADIDLSSFGEWQPIGTGVEPFQGVFDGGDFKITGLTITVDDGKEHYGLFGYIQNAALQNIHLRDVHIDVAAENRQVGALAGAIKMTTVGNVSVTGTIRTDHLNGATGGIAGGISNGVLSDSYSAADVSGGEHAGGLIGFMSGSTVQSSYASGNVAGNNAGGLIGTMDYSTVVNSYAIGNATSEIAGGASGGLIGTVKLGLTDSEVQNSYSLGKAEGVTSGGLIGKKYIYETIGNLTLVHVCWNNSANPGLQTIGGEPDNTQGRALDALKEKSTFAGWDFAGVWGITEDESTPYLLVFKPELQLDAQAGPGTPVFSAENGFNKVTVTGTSSIPASGRCFGSVTR